MARSHAPDIKDQTRRLTSRKNSTASLAGVDFPIGSFAENSVSSNNEDSLLCADFVERSRPDVRAGSLFAEDGQSGRLP